MGEKPDEKDNELNGEVEEAGMASEDIFLDESSDDDVEMALEEGGSQLEAPLTEEEIQELIDDLLDVESKAAEAQEALEKESLEKIEVEVREELSEKFQGDELENAVADEMTTYKEEWEATLDELETESADLLEQLDGAGIDLPSIYKLIEGKAQNGCCTEAWKKRTHWVGSEIADEAVKSIRDAEKQLQTLRPVMRKHGKTLEEGASGYLGRKVADNASEASTGNVEVDWSSLNKLFSDQPSKETLAFGGKQWASVYLASTPQQAAALGLNFPGVDEVEEIDDIADDPSDPFVADALANERELDLSEEQRRNFRKIKEEDDVSIDKKLQLHLKRRRRRKSSKQNFAGNTRQDLDAADEQFDDAVEGIRNPNDEYSVPLVDQLITPALGSKRLYEKSTSTSSDSDTNSSGDSIDVSVSSSKRKKKIRRILDDTELGEETKRKIAVEKERQERLNSLKAQFPGIPMMLNEASFSESLPDGASSDILGDALSGFIVNVARENGEAAVRIPPSISPKLKTHQVAGIRFMWENIIQSIRRVKAGDKGLGCILAHTMGLGKTFQVIAFLYTAMKSVDLGLRRALIVAPVNVLHNWRQEFKKWEPTEFEPLRVYMLEDKPREQRAELLTKWRKKGGVFLIGYTAFRNLALPKIVKNDEATIIRCALQEGPDILVCDEAHMIKNTIAETTQALKQVKCQRRIALTGSPLQNNLMEYYCMVDFVREGFLGSMREFRNRFQNPIENGQHANSTAEDVRIMNQRSHILYEQLKGFVQRMDMSVVKKDLPPKTVFVIAVRLSPLQRKLYKKFLDAHGFTSEKASFEGIKKNHCFAGYQALAQICNHPWILQLMKEREYPKREDVAENFLPDASSSDENMDSNGEKGTGKIESTSIKGDRSFLHEGWFDELFNQDNHQKIDYSGKMVLLVDILTRSTEVGDKVLVFSQSLATLDLIESYLSKLPRLGWEGKLWKRGKDWYRIDGKTKGVERQKFVDAFNNPQNERVKCTLISTRAGALGINLYAANRVIIVDGSWNPTHDLQAIFRAWRYGQKKPVYAYRLVAHGTIEEKIYKRQVQKEGLAARVVDRQQVHRSMSREEMLHLFEFGDDESIDLLSELVEEDGPVSGTDNSGKAENRIKRKSSECPRSCSSDEVMEDLLARYRLRWIMNFHEHETLLQENEEEKLTKEEQDMAWEVFQKSMEWEEVRRVPADVSQVPTHSGIPSRSTTQEASRVPEPAASATEEVATSVLDPVFRIRYRAEEKKCTSTSHLLLLRYSGIKAGCSTICGGCARQISWENLKI